MRIKIPSDFKKYNTVTFNGEVYEIFRGKDDPEEVVLVNRELQQIVPGDLETILSNNIFGLEKKEQENQDDRINENSGTIITSL